MHTWKVVRADSLGRLPQSPVSHAVKQDSLRAECGLRPSRGFSGVFNSKAKHCRRCEEVLIARTERAFKKLAAHIREG